MVVEPDSGVRQEWDEGKTPPFRVISRQARRDLSLTCRASGLDLACGGSVWLGSGRWAKVSVARCRGPQGRFGLVFMGDCERRPGDPFADLENRQRRKSFVGSNPTPSVFLEWLLFSSRGAIPPLGHRPYSQGSDRGPEYLTCRQ